nr:CoA-transferase [Defluviimonas sp. WL0075]
MVNNNAGNGYVGLAALIEHGLVEPLVCFFPRSADPRVFTELSRACRFVLELVPQGDLAERIRAGGAGGIDPEHVVTPGIFVRAVVEVPDPAQEEVLNRAQARCPEAWA